jgi:hypothetical protein
MAHHTYMKLDRLVELEGYTLKEEWVRRYGAPAPNLSPELLRLGLAYRLQELRLGGLGRPTRSFLGQLAARVAQPANKGPMPRKLTPGTRLVRDWHGVGHTVIVLNDGFEYGGEHWRSLTAIARAVTGTHQSGHRFFGLSTQAGR